MRIPQDYVNEFIIRKLNQFSDSSQSVCILAYVMMSREFTLEAVTNV